MGNVEKWNASTSGSVCTPVRNILSTAEVCAWWCAYAPSNARPHHTDRQTGGFRRDRKTFTISATIDSFTLIYYSTVVTRHGERERERDFAREHAPLKTSRRRWYHPFSRFSGIQFRPLCTDDMIAPASGIHRSNEGPSIDRNFPGAPTGGEGPGREFRVPRFKLRRCIPDRVKNLTVVTAIDRTRDRKRFPRVERKYPRRPSVLRCKLGTFWILDCPRERLWNWSAEGEWNRRAGRSQFHNHFIDLLILKVALTYIATETT